MANELLVLANAKSLEEHPFHLYKVDTIGMNHAYRYWKRIGWWPTYYCSVDKESNSHFAHHIWDLVANRKKYGIRKFLLSRVILEKYPQILKLNAGVNTGLKKGGKIVYFIEDLIRKGKIGFKGMFQQTSAAVSTRFGIYLGYSKIYLLGVDCSYGAFDMKWAKSMIDSQGRLKRTVSPENWYFFEGYRSKGDYLHIPPARRMKDRPNHYQAFEVLDKQFNRGGSGGGSSGVRIINLNPKSKLYDLKILPFEYNLPLHWFPEGMSAEDLNAQKPKVLSTSGNSVLLGLRKK